MPTHAKFRGPFAERLVQIRKTTGLSQYELADKTGLSQRVIAHYETVGKNPPPEVIMHLAKALKVSVDELIGHKPVKTKDAVSRKTIKKAKLLEELTPDDQKTVLKLIGSLRAKR